MIKSTLALPRSRLTGMHSHCFPAKGGAGHCAGASPARGFSVVVGHPVWASPYCDNIEQLGERAIPLWCPFPHHAHLQQHSQTAGRLPSPVRVTTGPGDGPDQNRLRLYRERKTLYTLIDEAHLLDMAVLRKLRLLFERFPPKHNLVLFGQLGTAVCTLHETERGSEKPDYVLQNPTPPERWGHRKVSPERAGNGSPGANTFDDSAIEIIKRACAAT